MSNAAKIMMITGGLIALPIVAGIYSTFSSVATAPSRVINKTLETDNIIQSYEWFHDANAQFKARVAQVQQFKGFNADPANDAGERSRIRMEMAAIQQSCRDLANKYNANATKTNKAIFMGRDAPESLSPGACE